MAKGLTLELSIMSPFGTTLGVSQLPLYPLPFFPKSTQQRRLREAGGSGEREEAVEGKSGSSVANQPG